MDLAGHSRAEGLFGGRHRRGAGNADYHGADLARDLDEDAAYDESYDGPGARRRRDAADDVQGLEARGARRGFVGVYSPAARRKRVETFLEKRSRRVWTRKVKYDVRKSFADTRMRVKGRFVKKEDEDLLKELLRVV
ncbi:hypothetical protein M885DRAFT_505123 [Pelagophyceae sp. CCMP2097]|nr:hypothetical protein M885DRAFT_505123 [Pelagophyceae sp. CCMP2097]